MSTFSEVLRNPGVARMIAAQLTARFPSGMIALALLLHIAEVQGSYTAAGLVLGATSAGQAVAGPLTTRWMGKWGMRRVLMLTAAVCIACLAVIALVTMSLPVTMVIATILGLSNPPVGSAVRTIYPKMVSSRQLTPLFSLDASAQEIIWVLGPVVTVVIATQTNTQIGLLSAGGIMLLGCGWFVSLPELGRVRIPPSRRRMGAVLSRPTVIVSTVVGCLMIGSFAAVEAGVVGLFGNGFSSGLVLAVFSIGSLVGGLMLGHLAIGVWSLSVRITIITAGLLLNTLWLNVWWVGGALFLAGFGVAPALAVLSAMVSSTVKFSEIAEAYGWVGTGQLIGAALGSAIAGVLIDTVGARGAFIAAVALAGLSLLAAIIGTPWTPDLRSRDSNPIPDTEPIPVQH